MWLTSSCLTTHLQTWVLTKVECFPWFGPFAISWGPPRDAKNCDVCHTGGRCFAPVALCFWRCRPFIDGTVLMGTNQKEDSPVKAACRVIEVMLMGFNSVFRGIDKSLMLTIIKTQSNTLEGSRLQKWGHISASILACTSTLSMWSNSEPKWTQSLRSGQVPEWPSTAPFIGKTYDVIARPVMSWICHGMTSSVFNATSYHNVTLWWHKQLWAPTDAACQQVCTCEKTANVSKITLYVTYIYNSMVSAYLFPFDDGG